MLRLATTTDPAWVDRALANLSTILLDHTHCEKKAASMAINLIFRYQDKPELMRPMSEIAREELEHFEQMLTWLEKHEVEFIRLLPSAYARTLHGALRKQEPGLLIDTLLASSLIEARSCERMKLLSEALPPGELADFYAGLLASEARHHQVYIDLALRYASKEEVFERLAELAKCEAQALSECVEHVRMHSA